MYNPTIGRFLTRDPSGERGGLNLYEYADNDPVNKNDPSGLSPVLTTAGMDAGEQQSLEEGMNLAWLQDEYEGWQFTPTQFGFSGIDARGRQMFFDSQLNQTSYLSGNRQFRLEYRDDGSVVRAWTDFDTGRTWDKVLVESAEIRNMRKNPYWDAYVDQMQDDQARLANTLALADGVSEVLDATVRVVSGPAGTVFIDIPEAVSGQNMTRPGRSVATSDRATTLLTLGVVSVKSGKRLLTIADNAISGARFERAAIREIPGARKNWKPIQRVIEYRGKLIQWISIPDVLISKKAIIEIKSGREPIHLGRQMLTQLAAARSDGLKYRLILSPRTRLTQQAYEAIKAEGGIIQVYNRTSRTFGPYVH